MLYCDNIFKHGTASNNVGEEKAGKNILGVRFRVERESQGHEMKPGCIDGRGTLIEHVKMDPSDAIELCEFSIVKAWPY